MSRLLPISSEIEALRDPSSACSFRRSDGRVHTWADFAASVAAARIALRAGGTASWILYAEDCYVFDVALCALVREGARVLVPGGPQAGLVTAIRGEDCGLVGDGSFEAASGPALDLRGIVDAPSPSPSGFSGLGPSRSAESTVVLFTSGSTGVPKAVPKRLAQLEEELACLHGLWGDELEGRAVYSTVSQQHIYGLLFFGLLPLCSGLPFCSERLAYPESIQLLAERPSALVASPAFLKRAVESSVPALPASMAALSFSSGGILPDKAARGSAEILGRPVTEIYGSSETGGVAYRRAGTGEGLRAFSTVDLRIGAEGRIEVRSPYLAETGFIVTEDLGEMAGDGTLRLLGRADSVVKIEEKRVSLVEIEARLRESPLVTDVHALALESAGRQIIGAAVVLSEEGRSLYASEGRRAATQALRSRLGEYFAPVLLPRKWRFLAALPVNEQGKIKKEAARALFEGRETPYDLASSESADGHARLIFSFPVDCPYFDGHFPAFKLLPAVAQIDVAMHLASEFLGAPTSMLGMPRVKFQKPVRPAAAYVLDLRYQREKGRIEFSFSEADSGETCSSGKIDVGPESGPAA